MKLLFATSTGRIGIGGHLYTVRAHTEAMSSHVDCSVVSLGVIRSPALDGLNCPVHHITLDRGRTRLRELRGFLDVVRTERPDVIHAFDTIACAFARLAARRFGCGLVLTICGGPNPRGRFPRSYLPWVKRLVLFSQENEEFIRARPRFRDTRIWRIPNRVLETLPDAEKVAAIRRRLHPNRLTILRVGRFGPFHEKTALQCVRLVKRLVDDGAAVQLLLLGAVQSSPVLERVTAALGDDGVVMTDPELVARGSEILEAGDLVVGTGRSFMEAAARGRVLLAPVHTAEFPALVTEANWSSLARTNFSGRSVPEGWSEERNYAELRRALTDPVYRQDLAAFSRSLFETHFALKSVTGKYVQIYDEACGDSGWQLLDFLKHWIWLMWQIRGLRPGRRESTLVAPGD